MARAKLHKQADELLETDEKTSIFWTFLLYVYNGYFEGLEMVWATLVNEK